MARGASACSWPRPPHPANKSHPATRLFDHHALFAIRPRQLRHRRAVARSAPSMPTARSTAFSTASAVSTDVSSSTSTGRRMCKESTAPPSTRPIPFQPIQHHRRKSDGIGRRSHSSARWTEAELLSRLLRPQPELPYPHRIRSAARHSQLPIRGFSTAFVRKGNTSSPGVRNSRLTRTGIMKAIISRPAIFQK